MTHSMLLKYKCGVCDQGFKQKIYLRSHMKKHTGDVNIALSYFDDDIVI